MKRTSLLPVGLTASVLLLAGCSSINTQPDETGLHYKGGAISSTSFANCVDPSTRNWDGPGDGHFSYPSGQRTYTFSADQAVDGGTMTVVDKNGIELTTSGVIRFNLNTDCETLQKFHEQIGLKFNADNEDGATSAGWSSMLTTYLRQPLQRAMNDATQGLDWKDLYSNPETKTAWEAQVKDLLPKYVEQSMGGEYLTGFSATVQKPDLPDDLKSAIQATQTAIEQNAAQKERNVQVQSELESIRDLVAVLGPDGYNTYQAIKDGKIQVVTIPQGSAINVTPQAPAQ